MKQESITALQRMRRQGSLNPQDKAELWTIYEELFEARPTGSQNCGDCVKGVFWKCIERLDKHLSTPPPVIVVAEVTPEQAAKEVEAYIKESEFVQHVGKKNNKKTKGI